jgi:hypothetical protein
LFGFPPLLITGNLGSTFYHISPGLGFDIFNGLLLGVDFGLNKQIKNWNFSTSFGAGINYFAVGGLVSYMSYGCGFYTTFYGNAVGPDGFSNKQYVFGLQFFRKNISLRIENDFIYYDRWRTSALEVNFRNFILGTFVYTNMPGMNLPNFIYNENYEYDYNYGGFVWGSNKKAFSDGVVYRSVFYVGYKYLNRIIRIGINHPVIQDVTQNGLHNIFNFPFFYTPYGSYFSLYFYIGYYNPFSLFGK